MPRVKAAVGATMVLGAAPALAHGTHDGAPGWTLDPWLIVPLLLTLLNYLIGRSRLGRRASNPRPGSWKFLAGWLVLALALVSPLHAAGERSFTMHMIEHELIMLVATSLLAASGAGGALAWGLPRPLRQALGGGWKSPISRLFKRLTEPVTATIVQGATLWLWHMPPLFDRALDNPAVHIAQHVSFFVSSLLFWWAMLHPRGGRSSYGLSAACLFVTSLIGGLLGALMALSESPWYARYAAMGVTGLGLDPVADQQLAGLVMWIPGGLVHGLAALIFFYRWFKVAEASHALPVG